MSPAPHLITFATPNFSQAVSMLRRTAKRFGVEVATVYDPDHPALAEAWANHPEIMSEKRGAGYWLWKPIIILDALQRVPDGTPVLYLDAAITFIADPKDFFALAASNPITLFSVGLPHAHWTKRDCFVEMDADSEEFWSLEQLVGGVQLYRNGPEARAFLTRFVDAASNAASLTDAPNIHGLPNLPGFQEHRHDQSVLTNLAQKTGVTIYPDPTQFGPWDDARPQHVPFGQVLHVHRTTNSKKRRFMLRRLKGHFTGGQFRI